MPTAPFQSKLLPHLEFVRECRFKRMSYPQIAARLLAQFSVRAAPSTIFAFVKVRARRRNVITLPAPVPSVAPMQLTAIRKIPSGPSTGIRDPWLLHDPAKPLVKDALPP